MIYRLVVHAPLPPGSQADAVSALEKVLAGAGVVVDVIRVHPEGEDKRVFHIEARHEAPSAYHAAQVSGAQVFSQLLADPAVGLTGEEIHIAAERLEDASPT